VLVGKNKTKVLCNVLPLVINKTFLHPEFIDYTIVDKDDYSHGVCGTLLKAVAQRRIGDSKEIHVLERYYETENFIEWVHCRSNPFGKSYSFRQLCFFFDVDEKLIKVVKCWRPGLMLNRHCETDMEFVSEEDRRHAAHWVALGTCGTDYFVELKIKQAGNNEVEVDVGGCTQMM